MLARATSERLTDEWPRALLDVYRGARSAGEIIAVLETAPPAPRERRRYEALFYLARWARRVGEHATAREQLRQVVSLAPPRSVEGLMARHELRTLGR